ncbi:MAG: hydrogenase maturation protease [Anaerolineales bacterium]
MDVVVIGIGQSLRGDDGAGLEAVRRWQEKYPQTARRVRVEAAGLPGLGLLDLTAGARAAVIVDAVRADSLPPGRVLRLSPDEAAAFAPGSGSAHGWGAAEALALSRALDPSPTACQIRLVGIVGATFALGAGLSPEVRAALDEAAAAIEEEVGRLLLP